ncbi:MAG: hypothetical protein AAGD32_01810 [Planctomycetota bacterium]
MSRSTSSSRPQSWIRKVVLGEDGVAYVPLPEAEPGTTVEVTSVPVPTSSDAQIGAAYGGLMRSMHGVERTPEQWREREAEIEAEKASWD